MGGEDILDAGIGAVDDVPGTVLLPLLEVAPVLEPRQEVVGAEVAQCVIAVEKVTAGSYSINYIESQAIGVHGHPPVQQAKHRYDLVADHDHLH